MMWMILQADEAEDWVIATGKTNSVRDFVKMAFGELGITLVFTGSGENEKAHILSCDRPDIQLQVGTEVLAVDPKYFRPTEVDLLIGDATKANTKLGWSPKFSLQELVKEMVASDFELMKKEQHLKEGGYPTFNYFE